MVVLTARYRDPGLALAVPSGELHSLLFFTEAQIRLGMETALAHAPSFQSNNEARISCILWLLCGRAETW